MKKSTKILAIILTASMSMTPALGLVANANDASSNAILISAQVNLSKFTTLAGTVKEVRGDNVYLIDGNRDNQFEVIITEDTYKVTDTEIKEGSSIAIAFDNTLPMTMQFPPRHTALVAAVELEDMQSLFVDVFVSDSDNTLANADNTLNLNYNEDTQIVTRDGQEYDGDLLGKEIIATGVYAMDANPPLAMAKKIIVDDNTAAVVEDAKKINGLARIAGTITQIHDFYDENENVVEGKKFVQVKDENDQEATFFVTEDTYFATESEYKVGDELIGFYEANAPMLMIYPPRYNLEVVAVKTEDSLNIKADRFDEDLVSYDNSLKLNVSDETEIVLENGDSFDGELANRALVVYYDVSTRSIPAQTIPQKIVVLYEKIVPAPIDVPEIIVNPVTSVSVDGKVIENAIPFVNDDGVLMLPLRAVAEGLGYSVGWDEVSQSVTINGVMYSLSIDKDYYTYLRTAPIELGTAPTLVDDITYVPSNYFGDVVRVNGAVNGTQYEITTEISE